MLVKLMLASIAVPSEDVAESSVTLTFAAFQDSMLGTDNCATVNSSEFIVIELVVLCGAGARSKKIESDSLANVSTDVP